MFKLHRWQEDMIRQLHEHWERREKPIQQLLHERNLVHVGVDFGTKDQMVATRYKVDGDRIVVLDIETIDFKIRGKPGRMILDDPFAQEYGEPAECKADRGEVRLSRRGKIPSVAERARQRKDALLTHLRGERPIARATRSKKGKGR